MKYTRITALAAITVAATLSLTACGGGDSGKDSSSKGTSTSSSSSADGGSKAEAGSEAGSESGAEAGDAKSGSGKNSTAAGAANGATNTSAKVTFCRTEDLAIDAQYAAAGADEGRINITMINRGSTTCSATGFAGVDIKDADHTSSPIARGQAQPRITTLKPGAAAVFDLAYTVDNSGDSLASPTNILVTPPNETHTVTLDWPEGAGAIKGAYTDVEVYPTHTTE
ncbi:DUF4232 domain-containing protein [Streptomyces sp. SID8379]|uniref:DUF4232 domain-containing protein n=1 Tax=unclassified Streptomyces TaxID=2593676 RepID=UPI00036E6449|nr:DUF4232 domain-containing protein [Streptomyces sp. HmicA12]MYW67871.1 DUF4232 domain-containing protein [Streptomyces sp. SID8379]